jgi:hypothetical protein
MRILGVTVLGLVELLACTRGPAECPDPKSSEDRVRLRDAPPIGLGQNREPGPTDERCQE